MNVQHSWKQFNFSPTNDFKKFEMVTMKIMNACELNCSLREAAGVKRKWTACL